MLSEQSKQELSQFIAASVPPNIQRAYTKECVGCTQHIKDEANLEAVYQCDRFLLVFLFIRTLNIWDPEPEF